MSRSDFFARLAAIERRSGQHIGASRLADEPVRFVPATSLSFAACDAVPSADDPNEWMTSFLGLAGADGALPPYLTEEIAREDPDRPVRRALLTPFHHRATALCFRSVQRCRVPEETRAREDVWPMRLARLVRGDVGQDPLQHELAILLAPLLHGRPSTSSLARALRIVTRRWLADAPVSLTERTGARVEIDDAARARLGRTRLGDTALLGSTIDDPSSRATIAVGPVSEASTAALLPGGPAHRALTLVVRWFGDSATQIEVVVHSVDAPVRLGAARLGQSALGGRATKARSRRLALDATAGTPRRQARSKGCAPRSSKELPCDPTPAHSSDD